MAIEKIIQINNKLITLLKYITLSHFIIIGMLILYDVVMRSFINKPVIGIAEIIGNSLVIIAFFQIAYTISINAMIRSEYL